MELYRNQRHARQLSQQRIGDRTGSGAELDDGIGANGGIGSATGFAGRHDFWLETVLHDGLRHALTAVLLAVSPAALSVMCKAAWSASTNAP